MREIPKASIDMIKDEAPNFIKAVERAAESEADILLMLDAFAGEPELLYNCLWYAQQRNVCLRFVPAQPGTGDKILNIVK